MKNNYLKQNFIFQDDAINYSFICSGKPIEEKNIVFKAKKAITKEEITAKILIKVNTILSEGDDLSKVIIGKILNETGIEQDREMNLVKRYKVLSKHTALFGEF